MTDISKQDLAVLDYCAECDPFPLRSQVAERFGTTIKSATDALRRLRKAGKIKWGVGLAPALCEVLERPKGER